MSGVLALIASFLAFAIPISIPLFTQRWRSFLVVLGLGIVFFGWMTIDINGGGAGLGGPFLGGLMLFGFAGGTIAKFVMLLSRPKD